MSITASSRSSGPTAVGPILVVDADATTCRAVTSYLLEHDLPAVAVSGRQDLANRLDRVDPALVILSLRVGQTDELPMLRDLRERLDVPVIVTIAQGRAELGGASENRVIRLHTLDDLLVSVRGVLQHHAIRGFRFGACELELKSRRLVTRNHRPVTLTQRECTMLVTFLKNPQRTLTRKQLRNAPYAHEDLSDRSVDVTVHRLRQKLAFAAGGTYVIVTEHSAGYRFTLAVESF
jgi:DNA-binding response OmpR family regulator